MKTKATTKQLMFFICIVAFFCVLALICGFATNTLTPALASGRDIATAPTDADVKLFAAYGSIEVPYDSNTVTMHNIVAKATDYEVGGVVLQYQKSDGTWEDFNTDVFFNTSGRHSLAVRFEDDGSFSNTHEIFILIDKDAPAIEILNESIIDENAYTRNDIVLEVKVTHGLTGLGGALSASGTAEVDFVSSDVEVDGREFRIYEITISLNGIYTLSVTGANGLTQMRHVNVTNIEKGTPAFTVFAPDASMGFNKRYIMATSVDFTLTFIEGSAISGLNRFEFRTVVQHFPLEPEEGWVPINVAPGETSVVHSITATEGFYQFRVVSNAGGKSLQTTEYGVHIDPFGPTITFVSEDPIHPENFTNSFVRLQVIISYGGSGMVFSVSGGVTPSNETSLSPLDGRVRVRYDVVINSNGVYSFTVIAGNGQTVSLNRNVRNIESTPPLFVVSAPNAGTRDVPRWVADEVRFTFNFIAGSAISGVDTYQYQKFNETTQEWDAVWQNIGSGVTVWTMDDAGDNGLYRFRALSNVGRASVAPFPEFRVNIDPITPEIEILNETVLDAFVRNSVVLQVSVKNNISGFNFAVLGGATFAKNNALSSDVAGEFTIYDVNVRLNGTYIMRVTVSSGEIYFKEVEVENIEIFDPAFIVIAPEASTVGGEQVWATGEGVTFTFTFLEGSAVSGLQKYQYRKIDGANVWTDVVLTGAGNNEWTLTGTASNGIYQFRALSNAGGEGEHPLQFWVSIDPGEPSIEILNEEVLDTFTRGEITLYVRVIFGASGGEFTVSGTNTIVGLNPSLPNVYNVTIRTAALYFLRAEGGNGLSAETEVNVNRLENTTPAFGVIAPEAGTLGSVRWVTGNVTFGFVFISPTAVSGLQKYQYQLSKDGGDTWGAWIDVTLIKGAWTLEGSAANGMYRFRAISNVGNISAVSTEYRVNIDTSEPVIEIVNEELLKTPTNADISLMVRVTYGASGGTFSSSGNSIVERDEHNYHTYILYKVTIRESGDYVLRAQGGNMVFADLEISVTNIVRLPPAILGSTAGGAYDLISGRTFSGNVTVFIDDSENLKITVTDTDGNEIETSIVNNTMTFTASGSYTITAIDAAGNISEAIFVIDKPEYALIIAVSFVATAAAVLLVMLIFVILRNKKAMQRLAENLSETDCDNKFLMLKKINQTKDK
jgi:hypothetical protein